MSENDNIEQNQSSQLEGENNNNNSNTDQSQSQEKEKEKEKENSNKNDTITALPSIIVATEQNQQSEQSEREIGIDDDEVQKPETQIPQLPENVQDQEEQEFSLKSAQQAQSPQTKTAHVDRQLLKKNNSKKTGGGALPTMEENAPTVSPIARRISDSNMRASPAPPTKLEKKSKSVFELARRGSFSAIADHFGFGVKMSGLSSDEQRKIFKIKALVPERIVEYYQSKGEFDRSEEEISDENNFLREEFCEEFEAAVLFADISGFTPLTAAIEKENPFDVATKILADHMSAALSKMVEPILNKGGDIIKFAGDAVLAVFTLATHRTMRRASTVATCVARSLASMVIETSDGHKLKVHCGVGLGKVLGMQVGGILGRWEYAITGEGVYGATESESHSESGQVVVDHKIAKHIESIAQMEKIDVTPPLYRVDSIEGENDTDKIDSAFQAYLKGLTKGDARQLKLLAKLVRPYVPRPVLERVDGGGDIFIREHRRCTTLFIRIIGLRHESADDLPTIHKAVKTVQKEMYSFGGATLCRFIMDEKGCCMFAVFGLPPLEHIGQPVRGVMAAMSLLKAIKNVECDGVKGKIGVSIGITFGWVFSGTVGSPLRGEYTLHGSAVNMAARLMVKSEGGILCDELIYVHTRDQIKFGEPQSITVKGRVDPMVVYRPQSFAKEDEAKYVIRIHSDTQFRRKAPPKLTGKQKVKKVVKSLASPFSKCKSVKEDSDKITNPFNVEKINLSDETKKQLAQGADMDEIAATIQKAIDDKNKEVEGKKKEKADRKTM